MLPHSKTNIVYMKYASLCLAAVLLAFTSAHAGIYVGDQKILRDASVYHDDEGIHSLIAREVKAENRRDYVALKQAIKKLSNATDPAVDGSK